MNINYTEILNNVLYSVITAVVPVISYYLVAVLKAWFNKILADKQASAIKSTLEEVFDTITSVVASTSQTYVDALKYAGTFNEESHKEAFRISKENIISLLSNESKELIESLYGDIDKWLEIKIEAEIKKLKS